VKLSGEQLAQYEREGFLVLENFVGEDACDLLRARAAELVRGYTLPERQLVAAIARNAFARVF
jgi:hypothetical protein